MNLDLGCSSVSMFGAYDKRNISNKAFMYMQRNTEFKDILEDVVQHYPDFTDDEIVGTICQRYNFDPKMDVPMQYHDYNIPLEDFGVTRTCKQFVLGRVHQLRPYYVRTTKYITLTLPDEVWSDRWSFSLAMNDLFIYCAATAKKNCKERNYVPIRIVLDKKDLEFFDRGVQEAMTDEQLRKLERRRTERKFDRKKEGLSPVDEKYPNKTVVLARELCQLTNLLNLTMYQSKHFPTLLFIDYHPRNSLETNKDFIKVGVM
jgi:hypothetical protein